MKVLQILEELGQPVKRTDLPSYENHKHAFWEDFFLKTVSYITK